MSRRILVTGGASGLGLAIAQRLAAAGDRVLVTDRDPGALELAVKTVAAGATGGTGPDAGLGVALTGGAVVGASAPEGPIHGLALDVTVDADWEAARDWCVEHWDGLDVLVNNAGVATGGRITHQPIEDWQWVVDINLLGVVRGCRTFTPLMQAQGRGQLVNIASLAGIVNPPANASYNVVKAGVISLSETLRLELEPDGIAVTVVCPSFFRTGLTASFRTGDPGMRALMGKLVDGSPVAPEAIAAQVVRGIDERRFLVLTDRDGRTSAFVKHWLPPLFRRVARQRTATLLSRLAQADRKAADDDAVPAGARGEDGA
jgi:NAD(P)-dependent dehydrogenase (short-subunit alcohol dehydrogenase family)